MHTYWYDNVPAHHSNLSKSCYHKSNICHFGNGTADENIQRYVYVCMDKYYKKYKNQKKIIRFPWCSIAYYSAIHPKAFSFNPMLSSLEDLQIGDPSKIGINKWWINGRNTGLQPYNANKHKFE